MESARTVSDVGFLKHTRQGNLLLLESRLLFPVWSCVMADRTLHRG